MKASTSLRVAPACALLLAAFSACGVDDRALSYEYRALEPAGASGAGGNSVGASGASEGGDGGASGDSGDSGAPVGGKASGGAIGTGGPLGSASGSSVGGASNNGGTTTGGASSSAGAPSGGTTSSAGSTAVAGAGTAGSAFVGPCGDLNNDLVDDCAQTLVKNSRFDTATTGWDAEPLLTAAWAASDASNKSDSGSLLLDNIAAAVQTPGLIMIGADQCIPATADTSYDVAARIMIGAGQAGSAGGINVWMYDDDVCKGNVVAANTPISGGVAGQWTALSGTLSVPANVRSLSVRLVAIKPFSQTDLKVSVDDVLVAKH